MKKMKRTLLAVCCAGVVVGGPALAQGVAADQIRVSAGQIRALGIESAPLVAEGAVRGSGMPARVVVPNNQIQVVSAPLAGVIQMMAVAPSDPVRKGRILARLQSPMLVEAQRDYLQAAIQARLAEENLKRDEQLFKEGIIAKGRYLATRSGYAQAAAALSERRQALRLYGMSEGAIGRLRSARGMSTTLDIVSPLDGVVLEQMASVGQRTEASTPLYKVARLDPLWIEIQVPASAAGGIAPGAAVSVPAFGADGKVLSVAGDVNPAAQTVTVRASVRQGRRMLRPGQYVEAVLAGGGSSAKQWRAPLAAVVWQQARPYVFVEIPGGFRAQPVTVLSESGDSVLIDGPFRGSERVAVSGVAALKAAWTGIGEE